MGKTAYKVFIPLDLGARRVDRLAQKYCRCLSEMRTVGPCGHVITGLSLIGKGFSSPIPARSLAGIFTAVEFDESGDEET